MELYCLNVILISVIIMAASIGSIQYKDGFEIEVKPFESIPSTETPSRPKQNDLIITDPSISDNIWSAISHIKVDLAHENNIRSRHASNVYLTGDNPDKLQRLITERVTDDSFPTEDSINDPHLFRWKNYKPRFLKKHIVDQCLSEFIDRSTLYEDYGYSLVKYRIITANVSDRAEYLLTFQLILYKDGTVYAKVLQFEVLYFHLNHDTEKEGKCIFTRPTIIGVIHEQYLHQVTALISSTDDHS